MNCAEQSNIIALVNSEWITRAERHRFAADSQNRCGIPIVADEPVCADTRAHIAKITDPIQAYSRVFGSLSEVVESMSSVLNTLRAGRCGHGG